MFKRLAIALCVCLLVTTGWLGRTARADEPLFGGRTVLVMVDDAGCVYCARWDREVKTGYQASPEGQFAPLERWRIGAPELKGLGQLVYTPTFIFLFEGREAGRITGYPGADFFWGEIDRLYVKAGFRPDAAPSPKPVENRASLDAAAVHRSALP